MHVYDRREAEARILEHLLEITTSSELIVGDFWFGDRVWWVV